MVESIILGIIQGIFEWLPISSQGNLVLLMVGFFDIGIQTAFKYSFFLHIGTLLAVIVYFRLDLLHLIKKLKGYDFKFKKKENSLISFLIISTIVTGLIGYPLFKLIADFEFRGEIFLALVGLALIFTGILQKFASRRTGLARLTKREKKIKDKELSLGDSVLLGILQGLAVIPGVSRSGITVSAFLFRQYNPRQSLRFSFLMSIPVIFIGGVVLPLIEGLPELPVINLILGLIFSFIFGFFTIKILLSLAFKVRFWLFCIIIGFLAFLPLIFFLF